MKTYSFLLALLVSSAPVFAQAPATPQPPVPQPQPQPVNPQPAVPAPPAKPDNAVPPVPGAGNAQKPAVNQAQVPQHNPDALAVKRGEQIDGSNWNDQGVADAYSDFTGKRVLLSSATQNMEIRFFQRGPLTNRQAADLLVKVLDMEGYVFVPSGPNEVKLLPKAQSANADAPGSYPEKLIYRPEDLPAGDVYVSYFMKMKFIKPEEAIRVFTQSVNALDAGTKMAPVPNAAGIIITSRASFIRKLVNQKEFIDVAAGIKDTVWVALKYADAEEVATTLNEIMNAQQQRRTTAGTRTATRTTTTTSRPPVPGRSTTQTTTQQQGATNAGEDIPVQIVASPRLNKIFIMGRPMDIVFVEGLAREFDAPPNRNNFIKRKLRFMIASDFLDVAANALEAAATPSSTGAQQGQRSNRQTAQNRNQGTQNRNQNNGQNGNRGNVDSVQAFNVSDVPESLVVGKTFIVADNVANSVLVQGPPESLRIVSELIDKLDGRPQQVMISTVFGEVTLDNDTDVGVSVGRTLRDGDQGAGSLTPGGPLVDLSTLGSVAGLNAVDVGSTAGGLNVYGTIRNLDVAVRALQVKSDFKVLSRPTVYTANNRVAVISSGRRIAVPTNTFQSGGTGNASQSTNIEFRDVLLRFEVVPLINSEHEVTLRISLLNEDTQGEQVIDGNRIPTIVTESLSTTVTVPNHATVVLGGLVTEGKTKTKSGVPLLSQIPALGRLFSRTVDSVDRRELLIFIQPKIISGEESQRDAQADMEGRYRVAPSTRKFADGVLPDRPKSKQVAPRKPASKQTIPTVNERPHLRYPTRR